VTLAVGLDVGGTTIDGVLVDVGSGALIKHETVESPVAADGAVVLEDCARLAMLLTAGRPVVAVGIGLCELVSPEGVPTSAETVDWRTLDVAAPFAAIAPVYIESDVRAAALAEARLGAGSGLPSPWLYVSVGTGISYSLVIDGVPFAGARGNALIVGAPPVERTASGRALQLLTGVPRAEHIVADPAFTSLIAEAAASLGLALAVLVNALDPALVVVGGGLGLVTQYRDVAVRTMREAIEAESTREVEVVAAALGRSAGAVGAALAAVGALAEAVHD